MTISKRDLALVGLAFLLGAAVYFLPLPGISPAAQITLSIFVIAAVLWVTEAVPLYVTAFVIMVLETVLLGSGLVMDAPLEGGHAQFITPFFSPIIVLFLGGFTIAEAMRRYRLDEHIAYFIIRLIGNKAGNLLLGLILITAFLSMWMSNTATTALMLTIVLPVMSAVKESDTFRVGLILAIPFAANLGGMATPVGSPPNAIALGALHNQGIDISFLEWMGFALPLTIILVILLWFFIYIIFKPRTPTIVIPKKDLGKLDASQWVIITTVLTTIVLWLTSNLHGIPSAVVALLPVVVFMGTGILSRDGLRNLGWDILLLLGGGLSLGVAVEVSGLSTYVAESIHLGDVGIPVIILVFASITLLLSTFMSNTATVNLTVPLLLGFGSGTPVAAIIACALVSSCAMALPISTPPNAIAYGSGLFKVPTMFKVGGAFSLIGFAVVIVLGYILLSLFGYTNS